MVLSHHKSGTAASLLVVSNLCCPEALAISEFLQWFAIFKKHCEGRCAIARVVSAVDGMPRAMENDLGNTDANHLAAMSARFGRANTTVVHFVRHPVDLVVSGYLYHRGCSEAWTKHSDMITGRVPVALHKRISAVAPSYCAYLQRVNASEGVEAEALRTLGAKDGLTRMLRNFALLAEPRGHHTLTVCLDTLDAGAPTAASSSSSSSSRVGGPGLHPGGEGTGTWEGLFASLGVTRWQPFAAAVREAHRTNRDGRAALAALAWTSLRGLGVLSREPALGSALVSGAKEQLPGGTEEKIMWPALPGSFPCACAMGRH